MQKLETVIKEINMPQPMKIQIPETMTLDQAKQLLEQQGFKVVSEEIPINQCKDHQKNIGHWCGKKGS